MSDKRTVLEVARASQNTLPAQLRAIGIDPDMPYEKWQSLMLAVALIQKYDGDMAADLAIAKRARETGLHGEASRFADGWNHCRARILGSDESEGA